MWETVSGLNGTVTGAMAAFAGEVVTRAEEAAEEAGWVGFVSSPASLARRADQFPFDGREATAATDAGAIVVD